MTSAMKLGIYWIIFVRDIDGRHSSSPVPYGINSFNRSLPSANVGSENYSNVKWY
jgi:hypothetical protein